MRPRHPRPTPAVAALLLTVVLAGCSPDADEPGAQGPAAKGSERTAATATSARPPVSSSSIPSTPPSPSAPISPSQSPTPTPTPPMGPLIASATWAESAYGATLKIAPTEAGRTADGTTVARTAWREVLALAPDADTPGMWEQFDCHWVWARILEPDKPTWNVEPWRPVVDEGRMVTEGCNPGGPEV